jgi:hypothetical protein
MGIAVKDAAASAKKFATRASAAQPDYVKGIQGSGAKWLSGAVAGNQNYKDGVNAAIARDAFAKGVNAAGPAKFEQAAVTVGGSRYSQGVGQAADAWGAGVKPYLDTIASITLPPKGPRGSAQNMDRASKVAASLHAKRVGG